MPIYGLQLDPASAWPRDREELTACYADRIREIQGTGPYRLLGWSLGGNIAHAVAARLEREGEQVDLLALLDAYPVDHHLRKLDPAERLDMIETAILVTMAQDLGLSVETSGEQMRLAVANGFGLPEQILADLPKASANLVGIVQGAEPPVFSGDMFFVKAEGSRAEVPGGSEQWRPYVGGTIEAHGVGCGHFEIMKPGPTAEIGSLLAGRLGA